MCVITAEIHKWEQTEARQILRDCGLREGMHVLDFGCGAPHYTFPAAAVAGSSAAVYAVDRSEEVLWHVRQRMAEEGQKTIRCICTDDKGLRDFVSPVDFLMYYDIFHSIGKAAKGMKNRMEENRALLREFHRLLSDGGIFSFAVYNEITLVQDAENGPFSPKGRPKWFRVPYDEAFRERYQFIGFIESCGFQLQNIVKDGGVHFDEIDFRMHVKKNHKIHLSALERRDIYNFAKQTE